MTKVLCPECNSMGPLLKGQIDFFCAECDFKCPWAESMMHTVWYVYNEMGGKRFE